MSHPGLTGGVDDSQVSLQVNVEQQMNEEMKKVTSSVHLDDEAVLHCLECDTHQIACHQCVKENEKHNRYLLGDLEQGLQRQKKSAETLLGSTEQGNLAAAETLRYETNFNKHVERALLRHLKQFDNTVDKLMSDLQAVKVNVHTAVQRAAQTKRGTDYAKLAKAVSSAGKSMNQVRRRLKDASLSNLSDFVDKSLLHSAKSAGLQQAMQVAEVDFDSITVNTSLDSQVSDQLSVLSERVGSLLQLSNDLVGLKPVKKLSALSANATSKLEFQTELANSSQTTPSLQSVIKNAGLAESSAASQPELQQNKQLLVLTDGFFSSKSYAYETSSGTWAEVARMSEERYGAAATLWNGKMVVAGICNDTKSEENNFTTLEQWDPESNLWTALPHMLHSRQYFALACFDNVMFAIGGHDDTNELDLASVERYNGETKQWQLAASLNVARTELCCSVLGVGILAIGGSGLDSCELFDGATQNWKLVASLTTARCYASAATLKEKVYVFGGSNKKDLLDSVEEYDSAADKWTLLPVQLSVPRYQLAAAAVEDQIYVCGGVGGLYVVDRFDASPMQITSLSPLPKALLGPAAVCVPVSDESFRKLFKVACR